MTTHAKEMYERWNKLMVLVFLRALCPEFLKAQPNMIDNSTVKSLENIYHFLCEIIPSVSHKVANVETQDHSTFAI